MVTEASQHLENSGAKAIVLCANTMHLIADRLTKNINIPVIHIASATAQRIRSADLNKVALLGTKFTMERDFFTNKLSEENIDAIIPGDDNREFIHYTIFEELGRNVFRKETRDRYLEIISRLIDQGAQGIILGCTEIPMMIKQEDANVPVFDTLKIHAEAAVDFSLS